ncbi:uncharacterized protein LOC5564378 [Aedes aegypti]|uniref:Uncharacterized protein n=1 Tax=Aedes aegypti TaxID=7159 RepID=A0A1S4G1U6_AEDAE|nr:uncharacterized protein LOC5564378 [Aedes aegypti]XP_021693779.1 uncharacterized protein LOC5564378 [Aedes aegypti]XP_021693780.1 uncharacterized protein LOC5564378 [Aedes aegypti]
MDDENALLLERATGLIKCCKLPRLTHSIDEAQLKPETFRAFLAILDETLPKVFDLLARYENQLLGHDEFNQDNLEFRTNLVLMAVEQIYIPGEMYDFQTTSVAYRERLADLYQNGQLERVLMGEGSAKVFKRVWDHYQKVLQGKEWMYHPGDVVGFVRVCEFLYGNMLEKPSELPQAVASFVLSIGISLVEFHDPEYEILGLRLFNVLLSGRHRKMLKESNIHEVVFQHSFRLSAKAKSELFLRELWTCLFQYVKMTALEQTDFSEWSKVDDVIEALLEALSFESNLALSSILILYLLKLLSLDLTNFVIDDLDDVQALDSKCHLYEPVLEQLRKYCALEFRNRRFYRWHKRLIAMLPFELEKACGGTRECGKYMHGVNLLFVLAVFPVEPEAVGFLSDKQSALLDFMIAFKRHMRDQYGRIQSLTGKCDFLHSLKASVSCDKTIAVFCRSVAQNYFPQDRQDFWTVVGTAGDGSDEASYQEDRIFYECLKELQTRLV